MLSKPGEEFEGGESVFVEQQPRSQSRAIIAHPAQGQGIVFPVRHRPVPGSHGYRRHAMRHGTGDSPAETARCSASSSITPADPVDDSSGTVTGTGLVDVTGDRPSVGELAAVGVLTGFRRRGIASALGAHLARTAHSQGISLVFLEAEPEEEQIYRRTGFTDATAKLWASIR